MVCLNWLIIRWWTVWLIFNRNNLGRFWRLKCVVRESVINHSFILFIIRRNCRYWRFIFSGCFKIWIIIGSWGVCRDYNLQVFSIRWFTRVDRVLYKDIILFNTKIAFCLCIRSCISILRLTSETYNSRLVLYWTSLALAILFLLSWRFVSKCWDLRLLFSFSLFFVRSSEFCSFVDIVHLLIDRFWLSLDVIAHVLIELVDSTIISLSNTTCTHFLIFY